MDRRPAEQTPVEEGASGRYERIRTLPLLHDVLQTVPSMTILLDTRGEIVHANRQFLDSLGGGRIEDVLGQRPGMALACMHGRETVEGCGSTPTCRFCGVLRTVAEARNHDRAVGELRLVREVDGRREPIDMRLSCRRIDPDGEDLVLVAMADVTDETHRKQLERAFFHDLLNTANILQGLSWTLHHATPTPEITGLLRNSVSQLADEIRIQRVLARGGTEAEATDIRDVDPAEVVDAVVGQYRNHLVARNRTLEVDAGDERVELRSDPALLRRVVGNLVKNALEASEPGQTVTVGYLVDGDHVEFRVHNATSMPEAVQHQVFKRSFSTKGAGRGIGTYSVKLFTEDYLGGKASFTSTEKDGTTFRVRYPLNRT
jgi:signal transduction histidine kinase